MTVSWPQIIAACLIAAALVFVAAALLLGAGQADRLIEETRDR